jgi:competence protein ComEA
MPRLPRSQLIAWGLAAALLLVVAVRYLGAGASAEPPPVRVGGAGQEEPGGPAGTTPAGAAATASGQDAAGGLYVHVAGAVARPGLYRVPAGSRVAAAVDAAGGPSRRAELAGVNLAAPLQDGQQVVVPVRVRGGGGGAAPGAPGAAAPGSAAPGAPGAAAPGSVPPGAKLSLSTATVEELDALDGIGPTLAQRIVEYRDAHGGFRSIDELREVEGIGEKRFESLHEAVQP